MNVGIVGAGIGGSGASFFLKSYVPQAKITVFEKENKIGGRIKGVKIDNHYIELGGSFYHSSNEIIAKLIDSFKLPTFEYNLPTFGIWNGSEFILKSHTRTFITALRMLKAFKRDVFRLQRFVSKSKKKIAQLYHLSSKPYSSLNEIVAEAHLSEWLAMSTRELLEREGFGEKFLSNLIYPAIHYIYNQGLEVNGFAGIATLLASDGSPIRSIQGGNYKLLELLLKQADADVRVENEVLSISKDSGKYVVGLNGHSPETLTFDIVIISTPLETSSMKLEIDNEVPKPRPFQKGTVSIVKGLATPEIWGVKSPSDLPSLIMTTENALENLISMEILIDQSPEIKYYNLFSKSPLSKAELNQLFVRVDSFTHKEWTHAYPILRPLEELPPIVLSENLYYVNAVESLASSMESSLISAKNIAMMISSNHSNH